METTPWSSMVWTIPTIITIASFGFAITYQSIHDCYFPNITNILLLIPAGFISLLAWIVYAVFK